MNKKITIALVAIVAALGISFIGYFYWKNLRGVAPAIFPPSGNIGETIDNTPPAQQNTTGFPLKLPERFSISTYAKGLTNARVMVYDPAGRLLVSQPSAGKVTALEDKNSDGVAEVNLTVISGLKSPHGLAFKCDNPDEPQKCSLYIAETNQVAVYDYDSDGAKALNKRKLFDLPTGGHYTRTLMFMPAPNENKLLISIGSSCNACEEKSNLRASVQVYDTSTGQLSEFAKGLRNTVFMNIHPVTGQIWGTDMGRDLLGDNIPPDEINIIESGKNYGWPYCYGKNIHDDKFDQANTVSCDQMQPSHIDMQAHSAPLGISFFGEETWPQEYWYNALVAYHGSWNRTEPTGYKIVRYKLDDNGKYLGEEDFLSGFLQDGDALGRPVDILIQPGAIFVSDDKAGLIYKIVYNQ